MELIDTLWNVNILADTLKKGKDVELIDTLWNVNASVLNSTVIFSRSN